MARQQKVIGSNENWGTTDSLEAILAHRSSREWSCQNWMEQAVLGGPLVVILRKAQLKANLSGYLLAEYPIYS